MLVNDISFIIKTNKSNHFLKNRELFKLDIFYETEGVTNLVVYKKIWYISFFKISQMYV